MDLHMKYNTKPIVIQMPPCHLHTLAQRTIKLFLQEGIDVKGHRKMRGRPSELGDAFEFNMSYLSGFYSLRELAEIIGVSHNTIWYHINIKQGRMPKPNKQTPMINEQLLLKFAEFCEQEGWPHTVTVERWIESARIYLCNYIIENGQLAGWLLRIVKQLKSRKLKYAHIVSRQEGLKVPQGTSLWKSPTISNVVLTTLLQSRVDLQLIARSGLAPIIEYSAMRFPGAIIRQLFRKRTNEKETGTFLIFRLGKVVSTGFKSVKIAEKATDYTLKMLCFLGLIPTSKHSEFYLHNTSATIKFKPGIDIERLYYFLGTLNKRNGRVYLSYVIYEPEIFSALECKIFIDKHGRIAMFIFATGSVILHGRRKTDIEEAIKLVAGWLDSAHALID
jgi:TATA-box binding protein (TBP) (component of TFIID and TFIIIB)